MRHLAIIPAFNEEKNIGKTIESIASQTQPLTRLIIVNDGSTDNTGQLLENYAKKYSWIKIVHNKNKDPRSTGAKIVQAFNLGVDSENIENYDIISKFDADLEFPKNYFQKIISVFSADSALGLSGGTCIIMNNNDWKEEVISKNDHIRGALKSYKVKAFLQMNGLREFMGWDSADEFLLRYYGWKIKRIDSLQVKHFRHTNHLNGWVKTSKLNAKVFHNLGYGLLIGSISSIKRGLVYSPYIISGLVTWYFFILQYGNMVDKKLDPQVIKFIRRYRLSSIFKKYV